MRYQSFDQRLGRARTAAIRLNWTEIELGRSYEGRPICGFTNAQDAKRIMAWSLMHGNEPTGFEALMDLMSSSTLASSYFIIPILNPDGAEAFTRLNAQGMDINRDARALISPEAQALVAAFRSFKPELVLNLHDQRPRFFPKGSNKPAAFSLLAPKGHPEAPNEAQQSAQDLAQRVLAKWIGQLLPKWPGAVARFDDQFYPTAFGEYFQEHGVATITFETGIHLSDWSRAPVGKQLSALLIDLDRLPSWTDLDPNIQAYHDLPMNDYPANEWLIHHSNGTTHLRLEERVIEGQFVIQWVVEAYDPTMPSWIQSHCKQSLSHLLPGTVVSQDQIQSFGISEDFGLNN